MGLNPKFSKAKVFVDSAPLIHFIEKRKPFFSALDNLFESNKKGEFSLLASVITLSEILVRPLAESDYPTVEIYRKKFLNSENFDILLIDLEVALVSAQIRADYKYKTPDALILGCTMVSKADFFMINDLRLKNFKEIPVITLNEL